VKLFADDLRLIAGIQLAARPVIQQSATLAPTVRSGVLPESFLSIFGGGAKHDEPVCHTEPAHAKCAGGFAVSRSSGCAFSQQEANNECAAASGYCIGCCAWIGSGCDCACLWGDLACTCESCGGTCGPAAAPTNSKPNLQRH